MSCCYWWWFCCCNDTTVMPAYLASCEQHDAHGATQKQHITSKPSCGNGQPHQGARVTAFHQVGKRQQHCTHHIAALCQRAQWLHIAQPKKRQLLPDLKLLQRCLAMIESCRRGSETDWT